MITATCSSIDARSDVLETGKRSSPTRSLPLPLPLYVTFSRERFNVNNPTRPRPPLRYRFSAINRVDGKGSGPAALLITTPRRCRKTCRRPLVSSIWPSFYSSHPIFPSISTDNPKDSRPSQSPLFIDRANRLLRRDAKNLYRRRIPIFYLEFCKCINDPRANSSYNATTFQLVAYTKRVSHAITNYYARVIKTINRE